MRARGTAAGVTTKAAGVVFQCQKGVLAPGLSDLFEALVVVRAAAHPIQVLRNERMIRVR
ncbi:MAG: hypothetical protein DME94_08915 [Verrucomicrobia bacterium]|nr:MAG: hypothetical protein DME94_08915 [Verrucomicrobiota bacterium]